MKRLQIVLLVTSVSAVATMPVDAAVISATTCSRTDVGNAVAAAAPGDTVVVPAGTCSWTTQLNITKGITLLGKGIDSTILQDNVPKNGSASSSLLEFNVASPNTFRLSGLTIQGAASDPNVFNRGHVKLTGTTKGFRVDYVKITNQQTAAIEINGDLWGVIDHCIFSGNFKVGVKISHGQWGGGGKSWGDGSWAEPIYWGTEKAIYIEDCDFTELSQFTTGAFDGLEGMRIVFRYNKLRNQNVTSHGVDSGQRQRGSRVIENYNNTFVFDHAVAFVQWIRGGTGVVFNNTVTGPAPNQLVQMSNCRDPGVGCNNNQSGNFPPWGACDGSSPYDGNTPGQTGYICVDQPGSGTSRLISGNPPPAATVGNIRDAVYIWGNQLNGASYNRTTGSTHVQSGRDFIIGTPRPGYSPYTYPHPLTNSTSTAPRPPTNLRIMR